RVRDGDAADRLEPGALREPAEHVARDPVGVADAAGEVGEGDGVVAAVDLGADELRGDVAAELYPINLLGGTVALAELEGVGDERRPGDRVHAAAANGGQQDAVLEDFDPVRGGAVAKGDGGSGAKRSGMPATTRVAGGGLRRKTQVLKR